MARRGLAGELHAQVAFFGNAYQRCGLGHTRHHPLQNEQTFVHDKVQMNASGFQCGGYLRGPPCAADFLIGAISQIHRALRFEALGNQRFDRLHLCHQIALVVPRASAPHKTLFDRARKGRLFPVSLCARRHGHHVLVRQ